METIKDILNDEFIKKSINLEKLGIKNFAWTYNDIIQLFNYLEEKEIFLLGGDVYKYSDNCVNLTYDSWFCNYGCSYTESLNIARKYVSNYYNSNGNNYIYSLVIDLQSENCLLP